MKAKINPEYDMLDRVWRVDTEGDEEGGSMRFLGVYKGRLDDIAFALADKAAYLLQFTAVDLDVPAPKTLRSSVNVRLNVESKTWHLTPVERVNIMSRLMGITSTTVTDSNFADAVRLQRNITEDDIKRYNALAKLTPEERELLGLSM